MGLVSDSCRLVSGWCRLVSCGVGFVSESWHLVPFNVGLVSNYCLIGLVVFSIMWYRLNVVVVSFSVVQLSA